jgi:transcriptional regulator with XRE-family HTH domain
MGRHQWRDVKRRTFTDAQIAEQEREAATAAAAIVREMSIAQIRRAIGLTQATIAQSLGVTQGEVSRLERYPNLHIATLRRYIEAMDGSLDLIAHFPGRPDVIVKLSDLERAEDDDAAPVADASEEPGSPPVERPTVLR